jgi:hypothetical protein
VCHRASGREGVLAGPRILPGFVIFGIRELAFGANRPPSAWTHPSLILKEEAVNEGIKVKGVEKRSITEHAEF